MKRINWNAEKSQPLKELRGVCFEDMVFQIEKGEWVPVTNFSERKKKLIEYAQNTMRKDKRLNIRISESGLLELQRKALKETLIYQTYVSSIIHKFVNGSLLEIKK